MARRRSFAVVVLALTVGLALSACFSTRRDVDVQIDGGTLRGTANDGVRTWRGIPYAEPPVGDLRWRPPQPAASWSGVRTADEFQSECLQMAGHAVAPGSSEDCLYLNVFRPDTEEQDLPVMVWIHGGGLVLGSGNLPVAVAAGLVEQDVVVVSLNYRLGRLGYFAHPALAEEGGRGGPVANFGLLDQVAALEWVQDNIAEFGGDPDAVTIFGISAGGASVNYLMASPLGEGLFDGAVSGSGLGGEQPPTWEAAAAHGEALAAAAGAPDADAETLRGLDAATVATLPAYQLLNQVPIRDRALPRSVTEVFAAGEEAPVPYLVGTTDLEMVDASYRTLGLPDPAAKREQLIAGRESEAEAAYGGSLAFERHFLNDVLFTEPARRLARLHAEQASTYLYRFSITGEQTRTSLGGAIHGTDYLYVFGFGEVDSTVENATELADGVSECWATFAKSGRPTCDGVTAPEVGSGDFLEFTTDGPVVRTDDPWQERLDLVASLRDGVVVTPP